MGVVERGEWVEKLEALTRAVRSVSGAIIPSDFVPATDAAGGLVESHAEAVMGVTAALVRVAHAIDRLAEVVRLKS